DMLGSDSDARLHPAPKLEPHLAVGLVVEPGVTGNGELLANILARLGEEIRATELPFRDPVTTARPHQRIGDIGLIGNFIPIYLLPQSVGAGNPVGDDERGIRAPLANAVAWVEHLGAP